MNVPKPILGMTWVEFSMVIIGFVALTIELAALFTNRSSVISIVMRSDGRRWSWEPFLFGLLSAHFYAPALPWSSFGWHGRPTWFPLIWIAMAGGLLVRDFLFPSWMGQWGEFIALLCGLAGGGIFWNQG